MEGSEEPPAAWRRAVGTGLGTRRAASGLAGFCAGAGAMILAGVAGGVVSPAPAAIPCAPTAVTSAGEPEAGFVSAQAASVALVVVAALRLVPASALEYMTGLSLASCHEEHDDDPGEEQEENVEAAGPRSTPGAGEPEPMALEIESAAPPIELVPPPLMSDAPADEEQGEEVDEPVASPVVSPPTPRSVTPVHVQSAPWPSPIELVPPPLTSDAPADEEQGEEVASPVAPPVVSPPAEPVPDIVATPRSVTPVHVQPPPWPSPNGAHAPSPQLGVLQASRRLPSPRPSPWPTARSNNEDDAVDMAVPTRPNRAMAVWFDERIQIAASPDVTMADAFEDGSVGDDLARDDDDNDATPRAPVACELTVSATADASPPAAEADTVTNDDVACNDDDDTSVNNDDSAPVAPAVDAAAQAAGDVVDEAPARAEDVAKERRASAFRPAYLKGAGLVALQRHAAASAVRRRVRIRMLSSAFTAWRRVAGLRRVTAVQPSPVRPSPSTSRVEQTTTTVTLSPLLDVTYDPAPATPVRRTHSSPATPIRRSPSWRLVHSPSSRSKTSAHPRTPVQSPARRTLLTNLLAACASRSPVGDEHLTDADDAEEPRPRADAYAAEDAERARRVAHLVTGTVPPAA